MANNKPHTEEAKAKISAAKKGKPKSQEWRDAMSARRKANPVGYHTTPHSEETKAKMRESQKLAWLKRKQQKDA